MLCIPLAHPGSAKGHTHNEIGKQPPKMLKTLCLTDPIVYNGFQHYQSWNTQTHIHTHKL